MTTCPICISEISGENVVELQCRHVFHATCLIDWYRRNPTCPVCRALPEITDRCAPVSMRALTTALEEELRAARTKHAPGVLRRAAQAFRIARSEVVEASRRAHDHRDAEPFRSFLQQQRQLDAYETSRRRVVETRATALIRAFESHERNRREEARTRGGTSRVG